MRKLAAGVAVFLLLAGLGGALYYEAVRRLEFQILDIKAELGVGGAVIHLTIMVSNPNMVPIYIPSADFNIYMNERLLGRGHLNATVIGAWDNRTLTPSIRLSYTDVAETLLGLLIRGGRATVKIVGSIHLYVMDVPFEACRTIKLLR